MRTIPKRGDGWPGQGDRRERKEKGRGDEYMLRSQSRPAAQGGMRRRKQAAT